MVFILKTIFCISAESNFFHPVQTEICLELYLNIWKIQIKIQVNRAHNILVSAECVIFTTLTPSDILTNMIVLEMKFLGAFFIVEHGDVRCYQALMTKRCTLQQD